MGYVIVRYNKEIRFYGFGHWFPGHPEAEVFNNLESARSKAIELGNSTVIENYDREGEKVIFATEPAGKILFLINKFPGFYSRIPERIRKDWDAVAFDKWASETPIADTEFETAQFILMVWDYRNKWRSGRFYIPDVLNKWDGQSKKVVLDWVNDPFFL